MLLCLTSFHIVKPTLSVFRTLEIEITQKPAKNRQKLGKIGQNPVYNRSETGEILGTLIRDQPGQLLLLDFFDCRIKNFTGRYRPNRQS